VKFSEVELPSNRKFGFFFTFVFTLVAVYFFTTTNLQWTYAFSITALFFLLITLIKSEALLPLNKLWMRFALLLGMIISPVVLGIIFFGLVTPYALVMKMFGRDELRLKIKKNQTNWKKRSQIKPQTDFTKQF
tara:strand:- start:91 stop:489 length:399 start_codon:yes stop_codon:yes gene_type:complete